MRSLTTIKELDFYNEVKEDVLNNLKKELRKSLAYHYDQIEVNREIMPSIAHSHEGVVDYIETELAERIQILMKEKKI